VGKRVFIIAGEASGDVHGAHLVKAMAAADSSLSFRGVGGRELREAGVQLLWDAAEVAVVGLMEVARHLATIARAFRLTVKTLRSWQPHLLILIDYPDFNLLLARKAKKLGIPVMYYISPQVWAWRSGRVKTIRRCVDRMVVLFPFEETLYREAGVPVSFVGHPFLDTVAGRDREEPGRCLSPSSGGRPLVGLLPGSRQNEVRVLLPIMLQAATSLVRRMPHAHFLLPLASTIKADQVRPLLQARSLPLTVMEGRTHEAIQACEVIVAASGSVTLEAAILGTPLVIVYKVNRLSYEIGRRLIRVEHIGLVNLVAGETVAPELIQDQVTAEGIVNEVMGILENPVRRAWIRSRLEEVRRRLGSPGASIRAAEIALSLLGKPKT
jgi:lipid-A-disaccharide synthase